MPPASQIGRHSAGPTWKLNDGSQVQEGELIASKPAPDPASIPLAVAARQSRNRNREPRHCLIHSPHRDTRRRCSRIRLPNPAGRRQDRPGSLHRRLRLLFTLRREITPHAKSAHTRSSAGHQTGCRAGLQSCTLSGCAPPLAAFRPGPPWSKLTTNLGAPFFSQFHREKGGKARTPT